MKSKMGNNPLWQKLIDCFDPQVIDGIDIADMYHKENPEKDFKSILKTINGNLQNLRIIEQTEYPIQTVPIHSQIDESIDVFDRVNSRGTKLTDAELVLTHITGKWPQARRIMKEKRQALIEKNFKFELDFFTRCMVVALTESALYQKNAKLDYQVFSKDDYLAAWEKISKALDYLIPILEQNALISGTNDMSTMNVLVPLMGYLIKFDHFPSESKKFGFLYWMFLSQIWSRYSGQTDARLDKDVYIATNNSQPIEDLVKEIEDQRGRIDVKPADLEGRGSGHPLYRMLYIVTKANDAIDWSNGGIISGTIGDYYSIHSHHVFPQSLLYKSGYNSENHLDKMKVNEIANRAFITRDTNFAISDKNPELYLPKIEEKYPGAISRQFISMDTNSWKLENYETFLQKRRELIAREINSFLTELKRKSETVEEETLQPDWRTVISKGENDYIEFKSSLRWDFAQNCTNKMMEFAVAKTVCAFLNSEGGRLFIGINDEGGVVGIEHDYKTLPRQNRDSFLLKFVDVINNHLGKEYHQYISVSVENLETKEICIVTVQPSVMPAYMYHHSKEYFFIRASASSQPMGIKEANEYINTHWRADR